MFEEIHLKNRKLFENYYEIFIDLDLDILKKRDPKGIYKKLKEGEISNVSGVDIKADKPKMPTIKFTAMDCNNGVDWMADEVLNLINNHNLD